MTPRPMTVVPLKPQAAAMQVGPAAAQRWAGHRGRDRASEEISEPSCQRPVREPFGRLLLRSDSHPQSRWARRGALPNPEAARRRLRVGGLGPSLRQRPGPGRARLGAPGRRSLRAAGPGPQAEPRSLRARGAARRRGAAAAGGGLGPGDAAARH